MEKSFCKIEKDSLNSYMTNPTLLKTSTEEAGGGGGGCLKVLDRGARSSRGAGRRVRDSRVQQPVGFWL